ncbi:MAG: coiled-coil domain-containing protein [Polaribacter sp.]
MKVNKTKVLSIRIAAQKYIDIFQAALNNEKSINNYILSSLDGIDKLEDENKKIRLELDKHKEEIKKLNKDVLTAQKKKPKEIVKEVVKIDDKAIKKLNNDVLTLKANHTKEINTLKAQIKKLTEHKDYFEANLKKSESQNKKHLQALDNLKTEIQGYKDFLNSLNLIKFEDKYSTEARVFDKGERVKF